MPRCLQRIVSAALLPLYVVFSSGCTSIRQVPAVETSPPTEEYLQSVRKANEGIIGQFAHCKQCRADAIGLIGKDMNLTIAEAACPTP